MCRRRSVRPRAAVRTARGGASPSCGAVSSPFSPLPEQRRTREEAVARRSVTSLPLSGPSSSLPIPFIAAVVDEPSRRRSGNANKREDGEPPPLLAEPPQCSISPLPSGTGFAIAERLGLEGASVVISSRKQVFFPFSSSLLPINYIHYSISLFLQQNVDEAAEKLRAKGIEVLALVCHVSNDQQRKNLIQKTAQCGNIDVIVSNAAANPSVDHILQTKNSEINVKASILLLKDAAPHLHKGSSMVIISSIAGFNPPASMSMYGVTKTALFGLTKVGTSLALQSALAAEMAPNTRVNYIASGFVPTNFALFITSYQSLSYCSQFWAKDNFGRLHDRSKETPKVMKQLGCHQQFMDQF
ncbi:hypothetical protein Ahy_B03g066309 [Arachis hypogaea]|uniref:Tropinone reductase-like 3 n=1 Tax=Arachis hypogaea TaxID=3818 RepID=A0A445A3R3_ARAHY|nr:hypothetical protein Ahy_B03g066309 [Arachis hypogaea]